MTASPPPVDRAHLRADCARCAGLCCVAPAFAASADFAIDKPAGRPCPNLRDDFRCGIHAELRDRGFPGCEVFDCFGAGQQLTQVTFGGRSWREDAGLAAAQFAVLPVLRQLHEVLWYLTEALGLQTAAPLHAEVRTALTRTEALTAGSAEELRALDVGAYRGEMGELLGRVSDLVRGSGRPDRRGPARPRPRDGGPPRRRPARRRRPGCRPEPLPLPDGAAGDRRAGGHVDTSPCRRGDTDALAVALSASAGDRGGPSSPPRPSRAGAAGSRRGSSAWRRR